VTPIKAVVTEKPAGYRKVSRNGSVESTTLETDLKVSPKGLRHRPSESVIGIYPQYAGITRNGRRRHSTTPQTELDISPISPLQEPLPHIEVNSITRRRNLKHNIDVPDTSSPSTSPPFTEPSVTRSQSQYVDVTNAGRRPFTIYSRTAIPEDTIITTTISPDRYHSRYTDISTHSGSTDSDYSNILTTEKMATDSQKYEHSNTIYTKGDGTVPSAGIEFRRNLSMEVVIDSEVQTTPPATTTPTTMREFTPQGPLTPETLPPLTTTRLTPTLTRIVTSVTESGTTQRQIISVNRVPYKAIAALRGQTVYPGPYAYNKNQIVPDDERTLNRTAATTVPIQPESTTNGLVEGSTASLTVHTEPKLEKVMEVNRVTFVTVKEAMKLGSTRAESGNETTEKMLTEEKSGKLVDKVSPVPRLENVTIVGGSLAVTQAVDYTTDKLPELFTTLSTPLVSVGKPAHFENAIDIQDEILSVNSPTPPTTSSFNTDTLLVTELLPSALTSKQTAPIKDTADEATSVRPLNNRRYQVSGRKSGIDDLKRRRTRPTFSTTTAEPVASSIPSTIYQRRRGQRKRPRPYRPTSTTVADDEAKVLPDPEESTTKYGAVSANQNNEHRRTFIPKRGQRKRPRPQLPNSTSANADEVINPLEKIGDENIALVTETVANTTVGFIPKRVNRRRGTTQKPTTQTPNLTTGTTQTEDKGNLSTAGKELNDVNTSFSAISTEPNLPDSYDSIKLRAPGVDLFNLESKSSIVPKDNHRYKINLTESSLKSELSDTIEVSTSRLSQSAESFALNNTSVDSELNTHFTSELNTTEGATKKVHQQQKEVVYIPSSTGAYTESVTQDFTKLSSSELNKSGAGGSDRLRVKKRRRRPPPQQNANISEESPSERNSSSGNKLDHDIMLTDLTALGNGSSNTPEVNSVAPFATAALLGRENYEIGTPNSVGEFLTTVDREGKHVVKISMLNDPNDNATALKTQRSKTVSGKDKGDDDNATAHNPSNNYDISSSDSGLASEENSDLDTDGSGYATGDEGRNSVFPLSDHLKPASENHETFLKSYVDVPSKGYSEGISRANSSKPSTNQRPKHYFSASVDFTADLADDQTLGSTAATDRNNQGSANPEGKTRRLIRRKRPSSTTEGSQVRSEVG
jgi:hypothetical protein